MSDTTLDTLATEIRQRMDAVDTKIGERISDTALAKLIEDQFKDYLASDDGKEAVRKMRFGSTPELVGTKYARLGLGVGDVEFLHGILHAGAESNVSKRGASDDLDTTFKAISEGRYMSTAMVRAEDERRLEEMREQGHWGKGRNFNASDYERAYRAMDSAESGAGQQLIGVQYLHELWRAPRRLGKIFPLIDSFEMTDPSTYIPVEVDIPEMLWVPENTSSTASDYATVPTGSNRVQVSAQKFIIHQMWSGELEEDSIIPFVPFLRAQAAMSLAHYSDSLVLNGDTTNAGTGNINLDDADPADTKHYLAFDGIRHAALVDNTANAVSAGAVGANITLDQLSALRGLMIDYTRLQDWGHPINSKQLVFVADPTTADYISLIPEFLTVDKYGSNATVLTGEVGSILTHPLVNSIAQPRTEADGKVSTTPANNTLGQVTAFNTGGFKVGWRRRVQVETERLPGRDQTRLIYSLRMGYGRFTPTGSAGAIESAAVLYNI